MIERFYKPNSNFVYVRLSGSVNDHELSTHLSEYNQETAGQKGLFELCDCRDLVSVDNLTVNQCFTSGLDEKFHSRAIDGKLAILVTSALQFGLARAFQMSGSESGRDINVFYDFDKAMTFLCISEPLEDIIDFIKEKRPKSSTT